jgi:hypothetical protein
MEFHCVETAKVQGALASDSHWAKALFSVEKWSLSDLNLNLVTYEVIVKICKPYAS